jgi:hypothetical protein
MNDEVGRMWKEAVIILGYYPSIRLGVLRKVSLNLSQNSRCPDQNSNLAPLEYTSEALPPQPTCSMFLFINYPKYKFITEIEQLLPRHFLSTVFS